MLFCDILKVEALGVQDIIKNTLYSNVISNVYDEIEFNFTPDSLFVNVRDNATHTIVNSQGYPYVDEWATQGVQLNSGHVKIPYNFFFGDITASGWNTVFNWSDWDENAYFMIAGFYDNMIYSWSDGSSSRSATFSNVRFTDLDGRIWCKYSDYSNPYSFIKGRDMYNLKGVGGPPLIVQGYLEFDYDISNINYGVIKPNDNLRLIFHPSYRYFLWSLKDDFKYDIGSVNVSDSITQQELHDLNESTDAIEDSTTNPNGGGILGTIKNFFGGFFGWLKDLLLGLFIPDSDYFSTWFSNLNNLLSVKLGMLYAPFDLLITVLNAVYSSSTDFSGVPFPEIRWGDTVLIASQNLTFSSLLGEHFSEIQGYVYFATDVVFLFAFLLLLQRKISLILRGHESG